MTYGQLRPQDLIQMIRARENQNQSLLQGCTGYVLSKDTLLVGTGVFNVHNALQHISSTALPENLHSIGKDISPLVKFKVNTELPDYITLGKYNKTIHNVIST